MNILSSRYVLMALSALSPTLIVPAAQATFSYKSPGVARPAISALQSREYTPAERTCMAIEALDAGDIARARKMVHGCDIHAKHGKMGATLLHSAAAIHGVASGIQCPNQLVESQRLLESQSPVEAQRLAQAERLAEAGKLVEALSRLKKNFDRSPEDNKFILDLTRALLEQKADPNAETKGGARPLHCGYSGAMTHLLMQYNADPTKRTKSGALPIEWKKDPAAKTLLSIPYGLPRALAVFLPGARVASPILISPSAQSSSSSSSSSFSTLPMPSAQPEMETELAKAESDFEQQTMSSPSAALSSFVYLSVNVNAAPSSPPMRFRSAPIISPDLHVETVAPSSAPQGASSLASARTQRSAAAVAAVSLRTLMEEEAELGSDDEAAFIDDEELSDSSEQDEEMTKEEMQPHEPKKRGRPKSLITSFTCETCGMSCANRGALRRHERTHTGERPYKCKECPKGFTQPANLTRHMLTHTGERPFPCNKCPKRFSQKSHLDVHSCEPSKKSPRAPRVKSNKFA